MKLRRTAPGDVDALTSIINRAYVEAMSACAPAAFLRDFSAHGGHVEYLSKAWQDMIVAEDFGSIRGLLHRKDNEIVAIFVDPNHQNKGYGTALMREALAKMKRAGYETATLRVTQGNTRATRFYERHGWKAVGTEQRVLGTSARWSATLTVMTKPLEGF